jgi:hypothetical protein
MPVGAIQSGSTALVSVFPKVSGGYHDPKDTNQDGLVSAAEKIAYALKHPELEALNRLRQSASPQASPRVNSAPLDRYTQKGVMNAWGKTLGSSFDSYA